MKIVIIGDLHLRMARAEAILRVENPDQAIFLGDYFDDFHDNPPINKMMAEWIKAHQKDRPQDIYLFGNHDLAYAYPSRYTLCSGNTTGKAVLIDSVLKQEDWDKFKLLHWLAPNWLCTHAGLHPTLVKDVPVAQLSEHLAKMEQEALVALKNQDPHWMILAGRGRGGREKVGGITWCDFNSEFSTIPGLNQIFGHTQEPMGVAKLITDESQNYDFDTVTRYYGVWDGQQLTVKDLFESHPYVP